MRAVVQRVKYCRVEVDQEVVGETSAGLLVYLGVGKGDSEDHADWLVKKIPHLRIFTDHKGQMNLSALDLSLDIMVISQFTLYGEVAKGRRPYFGEAAHPDEAKRLYEYFVHEVKKSGLKVATGQFQASMHVDYVNDGPVTIMMDSKDGVKNS